MGRNSAEATKACLIRRARAAARLRAAGLKYFLRPLGAVTDRRLEVDFRAVVDFPAVFVPLCVAGFFAGVEVFFPGVAGFLAEVVAGFFFCVVVSSELEDFAAFSS
jgi:hypothetical protein